MRNEENRPLDGLRDYQHRRRPESQVVEPKRLGGF